VVLKQGNRANQRYLSYFHVVVGVEGHSPVVFAQLTELDLVFVVILVCYRPFDLFWLLSICSLLIVNFNMCYFPQIFD